MRRERHKLRWETKVIKIGNSIGIIIPKFILDSMGWKVGTRISSELDSQGNIVYRKKNSKKIK